MAASSFWSAGEPGWVLADLTGAGAAAEAAGLAGIGFTAGAGFAAGAAFAAGAGFAAEGGSAAGAGFFSSAAGHAGLAAFCAACGFTCFLCVAFFFTTPVLAALMVFSRSTSSGAKSTSVSRLIIR